MFRFLNHSFHTRRVTTHFPPSIPRYDILYLKDPGASQSRIKTIFNGQGNYKEIHSKNFSYIFYRTWTKVLSCCWCTSRFQDLSTLENTILHKSFTTSWWACKGHQSRRLLRHKTTLIHILLSTTCQEGSKNRWAMRSFWQHFREGQKGCAAVDYLLCC